MKKLSCALIVLMSTIVSHAQTNERVYIAEVTALTHEKSTQIVSVVAFQSLKDEMTVKNQLLSKAVDLATKEWSEKHGELGPFPRQTASPGEIKSLGQFISKSEAEKELKRLQTPDEQERKKKLSGAEKQLEMMNDQLKNLKSLGNRTTQQQNQIAGLENGIKTLEEQVARKQKKEEDKDANLALARDIFRVKLQQLLTEKKTK